MHLEHNMGQEDRWTRGAIAVPGAFFAAITLGGDSTPGIVLITFGLVMLTTAIIGSCPVYAALHISTQDRDHGALHH
jgi:hypothetical protein